MQAGRELDALVAVHVMGWTEPSNLLRSSEGSRPLMYPCPPNLAMGFPPGHHDSRRTIGGPVYWELNGGKEIPHFSTEIEPAMQVFRRFMPNIKLDGRGRGLGERDVVCRIWTGEGPEEEGSVSESHVEIPMAIILAALKAVGVEVPA